MSLMVFNRQEFELGKYVPCYCSYMNKIIQFYNKCKLSFSLTSKTNPIKKKESYEYIHPFKKKTILLFN